MSNSEINPAIDLKNALPAILLIDAGIGTTDLIHADDRTISNMVQRIEKGELSYGVSSVRNEIPENEKFDWHADAQFGLEQWEKGVFDSIDSDFVAIYQKTILGSGDDPVALREKFSKELEIPINRVVIKYVGQDEIEGNV